MARNPIKILHITGHLGGGVGTVVLNYLANRSSVSSQKHSLLSLDYVNPYALQVLKSLNIEHWDSCHSDVAKINACIHDADIVLLHWWNHPLITDLMVRHKLPASRLVIWCHISGSPAPNNFTLKTFEYPDKFVFTTPVSFYDPVFMGLPKVLKEKVVSIWSTGGVERLAQYSMVNHDGFNVGYIGNLDFTKIHPNFIEICQKIKIPNIRFTVVGPINEKLVQMASDAGILDKIRFTGFISEEQKWQELSKFDIFGYPLSSHHYGTCDQVLQEAMALGVVPVVLNNPMESYMVKDGVTGIVANSINSYVESIHKLFTDKRLRKKLSIQAKKFAFSEYTLSGMSASWNVIFSEMMKLDKKEREWLSSDGFPITKPHQVFLESLGIYGGVFSEHLNPSYVVQADAEDQIKVLGSKWNWSSNNKSTVHQFLNFFPEDKVLLKWSNIMRKGL